MANIYLREGRPSWEEKDCFVISLAYALNIHYSEAHAFCKSKGRKDKKRSHVERYLGLNLKNEVELKGYKLTRRAWRGTVEKFKNFHAKGTFIVVLNNHAYTQIDGEIFNQTKMRKRIECVIKVEKIADSQAKVVPITTAQKTKVSVAAGEPKKTITKQLLFNY